MSPALYRSLTRGLLGCCISCIDRLLSARCLLSEGEAEPIVQVGDNACQIKSGQLLYLVNHDAETEERGYRNTNVSGRLSSASKKLPVSMIILRIFSFRTSAYKRWSGCVIECLRINPCGCFGEKICCLGGRKSCVLANVGMRHRRHVQGSNSGSD